MTPASRRPRFEPLRSATPPSGAQNAHHSIEQVVQFSMSPPVQFRMSFDNFGNVGAQKSRRRYRRLSLIPPTRIYNERSILPTICQSRAGEK